MAQFFFHTRNGGEYFDSVGVDLPNEAAAALEATRLLGALLTDRPEDFLASGGLEVIVMTIEGKVAFTLDAKLRQHRVGCAA